MIVTGTPEEQHTLGARMFADFLEADGWEVVLLGAGSPVRDVVELVDLERPTSSPSRRPRPACFPA